MKEYKESTISRSVEHILRDEFNDQSQNEHNYEGKVSGHPELTLLLKGIGGYVLNVGSAGQELGQEDGSEIIEHTLEPNAARAKGNNTVPGWAENIECAPLYFDAIIAWGVLCFLRSLPEALIEFNDHLQMGGKLVVDVVAKTVMPLAQTSDPDSFVRFMQLYGFELEHRIPFGSATHVREGFRFKKVRNFDPAYLRIPQCMGKINNFLYDRDWFLA